MGKKESRKAENSKNQSTSPLPKERISSPAMEQSWMENDFDELREEGFRRSNFSKLKEELRTHHKEAKNLGKRLDEWLTGITNVEKSLNDLIELKTMTRELCDKCTSFSNRFNQLEERVSVNEDQMNEMEREEKFREKRVKRNEQSLQEIWDYVKRSNLCLIGVPQSEGENGTKLENTLQDITQENFPNLARQANIQIQEIQRTPKRYSSRRATPRHTIVRLTKVEMKEKMLRAANEKGQITHKRKPIRLTVDLLAETVQARREWGPIFNILKEKNFKPRISYPAKLSFTSEGEIKSFTHKQTLRDFVTPRPALQELLKEALNTERYNWYQPLQKHSKM
uniref:LINE-1 retrotransposable element ORF1 protein n=1 Tax=Macaca fascicularis TaxID=9541 RepID=A0A7N9IAT9_MACFA